jgi:murein L,D-transpeptidase YcbB/YkuD
MLGGPAQGDLTADIERLVMQDALGAALGAAVDPSAVQAARIAYAQDLFQPIWTREGAASLLALTRSLSDYALDADRLVGATIDRAVADRFDGASPERRAAADLTLTAAWLRIAAAVGGGLNDKGAAVASLGNRPSRSLLPAALRRAGEGDASGALAPFETDTPQYTLLKRALLDYREIRARGGWYAIPSGDVVRQGDSDDRVPAIRARLQAEGYAGGWDAALPVERRDPSAPDGSLLEVSMAAVSRAEGARAEGAMAEGVMGQGAAAEPLTDRLAEPTRLDGLLVDALKVFQGRHGLEPDGVVGPMTLAALNESVDSKIERIARAMNQWRRQGALGARHVWANIPSFTVEGWNAGRREIRMKTIVGKPTRATPIFSDEIEYTVANPKWYVPVSIARRDKLPKLIEDSTYADRKGFAVYERSTGLRVRAAAVDWRDPTSVTRYRLVQDPGATNALGDLKIIFPNRHSVYLHGTPSVSLFKRASRAFSSGCVRLQNPVAMAAWLASHDTAASETQIRQAVASGKNRHIRFGDPVPVHLTYVTVTVDDEGVPNFWRDIYKRDEEIQYVEQYAPLQVQTTASVALDGMGAMPAD